MLSKEGVLIPVPVLPFVSGKGAANYYDIRVGDTTAFSGGLGVLKS